ncbi:PmeII family type II restriction endonuclease [Carnobacterium divergens]|uniref:Restriction endonuclease n=1 Tax=Carnobacterium divergens TaxID=2748 RepID=A0A7Z8CYP7_CARDV|nr:PmeII family type II restriction endonuclease [Carnobacterium divergens]TFI73418.1 restriction endonuclease [Carnobacterium divergens]TFI77365.1 restriction endonuclease [Carnobacterium divergens]TFI84129.1 restriction endonuclease [Carnobacterium divergens]TFI95975.1 restriction endonuclease [Carnobacterium divergens]TFJ12278.1 restriction endonuclease [Carnobacterium divergens]
MSIDQGNIINNDQIIEKAKIFFKDEIVQNHIKNTEKLVNLKEFQVNPFLDKYKANFLEGNDDAISIAKALAYPRILGTSINTIFGNQLQKFCNTTLEGFSSTTSGIDIEFIDKIDHRKKYCQIKAGPNTINKDDIITIKNHFKGIRNLARTNHLQVGMTDCVVGVFYGEPYELSNHYKKIDEDYPVYIGKEFWHRLTGDVNFYSKITDAIGEVAKEVNSKELVNNVIEKLAQQISQQSFDEI